jgi:hypothetical protein
MLRLLLKRMQYINSGRKANSVNSSIGIAMMLHDNLQDTGTPESLQRLGAVMLLANLGEIKRITNLVLGLSRKSGKVLSAGSDPEERLRYARCSCHGQLW